MTFESEQVLTKTPQGVNATRSGAGLSPKAYSMLKLFDGTMQVAAFKTKCAGASITDADFQPALNELVKLDHLRVVNEAAASAQAEAEKRMLLTLDFTASPSPAPAKAATTATVTKTAAVATVAQPASAASTPAPAVSQLVAMVEEDAVEKTARLKREAEARQKLIVSLQPRIEEELRARLRPKLEQELRPKLIAALRPGIEAEVRTALVKELTPRVELELKARFAKTLAAQKAADEQAAAEASAAAPIPAPAAPASIPAAANDGPNERLMASISTPLFGVDKTGVLNYASPAWAQLSGYTAADLIGKPLVDFFAEADRRGMLTFLTGIINGTALRFEKCGHLVRKEGEPLWVEISAAPMTAVSGETTGVCGVLRDATEARRMAEQAEGDGVRLLLLVDQIDTGVILEDAEGNIQQANPALCTLLSLEAAPYSLEGMPVTELFETAARGFIGPDGFLRRVSELREAGDDAKGESFVMADGRVIEQDYLAVTVGDNTVGHVWLFREMQRPQVRGAA